jgi:hypothetical protein
MTLHELFEKVTLKTPIEQRRFLNYFADTVQELQALYDGYVFVDNAKYTTPTDLFDDNVVLPLYHNAIVDNILYIISSDGNYKNEFLRKSKEAYLKYWNDKAKGKRQRRMRW